MAEIELQLKARSDNSANWAASDPILASGEIGYDTNEAKIKVGNGFAIWSELNFIGELNDFDEPVFTTNFTLLGDGSVDQDRWKWDPSSDGLSLNLVSDDLATEFTWMRVERSGTGASIIADSVTYNLPILAVNDPAVHIQLGQASTTFPKITRVGTIGGLTIAGGDDFDDGGYVALFGSTHPTAAGDVTWGSSNIEIARWDESAGVWNMYVGSGGSKSLVFNLNETTASTPQLVFGHDAGATSALAPQIIFGCANGGNSRLRFFENGSVRGELAFYASAAGFTDLIDIGVSVNGGAPSNSVVRIIADNIAQAVFNEEGVDIQNGVRLTERAAAAFPDLVGHGQLYILDTDSNLYYVNDAGTEFDLTGIGINGTPVDDQIAIWTGAKEVEGQSTFTKTATQLTAENYVFNIDETVGSGQDNYVLTYDDGTGEIGLEVIPAAPGVSQFTAVTETTTSRNAANWEAVFVDDDTAAGAVTINLPAGSTDAQILVKKLGTTANVTLDGDLAETIDGATTFALTAQYSSVTVMWNGSEWSII